MNPLKILVVGYPWPGGTLNLCIKALRRMGHTVEVLASPTGVESWLRQRWLPYQIAWFVPAVNRLNKVIWAEFNQKIIATSRSFKPDVFFTINEAYTYPKTVAWIRKEIKCPTVCWVADFPFDSRRFTCFPVTLEHFTHIFVGEPLWMPLIRRVANPVVLEVMHGAADTDQFRPVGMTGEMRKSFESPLAFIGDGYGALAEGLYRGRILEAVADLGLKIWGPDWDPYFRYYPSLREVYQGRKTTLEETNIINQASAIVLNIPNPQCLTAMQQRTFEIAASGGFQLADRRSEIDKLFQSDTIIQFSTCEELREKAAYYLDHETERVELANKARNIVLAKHTYEQRMQWMIEMVYSL